MPINRPSAPLSATAALLEGLPAFLSDVADSPQARRSSAGTGFRLPTAAELGFPMGGNPPSQVPDYSPLRVFILSVGDVMKGRGVSAASSGGWRFYVGDANSHMVMAWVSQRAPSGIWKITATFYGDGVGDSQKTSQALRSPLDRVNFEMRLLSVPSLNLEAFWLKAMDPGFEDAFSPYPNLRHQLLPGLNTQPSYTEDAFLGAIRAIAPMGKYTVAKSGG